ncbi:glycerol kinase GlpK [Micrococcoides hystricis]|uniref:ATP:glycerol 3-phosphotransferase n=1 Tax=Micrococcoides hystricis TaxID=1572761 RepID=A0ABV6P7G4_9MICC
MEQYFLAIDQGTTSTRAILFTVDGQIREVAAAEHRQYHPQPGWVEHSAEEIWSNTSQVIENVMTAAEVELEQLLALGITNQRESVVFWDRETREPLTPVIVWQDSRTQDWLDEHSDTLSAEVKKRSGLPLTAYFSASKISWLLRHDPDLADRAKRGEVCVGTMDTWLLHNLTGGEVFATDVTNASRTMLYNLQEDQWDETLCQLFEIPAEILPQIRPSAGDFGTVTMPECIAGVKITAILGDQQAAAFGQHAVSAGQTKNTYGTGCFLLQNTGTEIPSSEHGLIPTVAYQIGDQPRSFALEGSIAVAGSALQWLRDQVQLVPDTETLVEVAASVDDTGGVYFVPAFSGLYAPYWDTNARGLLIGMTGYTTNAHILRAALESTAYQSVDVLTALADSTGQDLESIKVDGGMAVNDQLLQFQADLLNVPVQRPTVIETTARGAALAAGLGVGHFTDLEDLAELWQLDTEFSPSMDPEERAELLRYWHRAIERTRNWLG